MIERCPDCKLRCPNFFCSLNRAAIKMLDRVRFMTRYPQGALLYMEGDSPRGVSILCRGRVKLSIASSQGKALILQIVQPGEVLGLDATVFGRPYQATAETVECCQIAFVKRQDFMRLLQRYKEPSIRAAQQLSGNYESAISKLRSIGLLYSVRERLALFLLDWAGQESKQGTPVRLTLTHEEISQLIGTSRESVSRTFSKFRSRQLATLRRPTLIIRNRAALEKITASLDDRPRPS